MQVHWEADPSPGEEDGEPASGEMEARDLAEALATLQETYPPGEWAVMVTEIYTPPPVAPGEPTSGG